MPKCWSVLGKPLTSRPRGEGFPERPCRLAISAHPFTGTLRSPLIGLALLLSAVVCSACSTAPSPLNPRTEAAAGMAELGWVMFALATAVCVAVFAALFAALRVTGRRATPDAPLPAAERGSGNGVVVLTGMVLPGALIVFTLGYTIYTLRQVAGVGGPAGTTGPAAHAHADHAGSVAHAQTADAALPLDVRITGKQWWWQVSYPDAQIVTANEIHVPVGVPIRLTVTSEDVIHSFWVPQVAGKVDVIPGRFNTITIQVNEPGTYRGLCSEFCGLQHARMHLFLVARPPADFEEWLRGQQQPAALPTDPLAEQGRQVLERDCGRCHAVRGTTADGRAGPDLTHVMSRGTLGAGLHQNTRANLDGWVADPQAMKVGNLMPSPDLSEADLRAVLAYLELLR